MSEGERALKAKLAELRRSYIAQLPGRMTQIDIFARRLRDGDPGTETLKTLHRLVHSLTGSGATFGLPAISDQARVFELQLKALMTEGLPPEGERSALIDSGWGALRAIVEQACAGQDEAAAVDVAELAAAAQYAGGRRNLLLIEDDRHLANDLALQLGHFGYSVTAVERLEGVTALLRAEPPPAAVVVDIMLPDGDGAEVAASWPELSEKQVPLIIISSKGDFWSRLKAVRAGAKAYFVKPIDIGELIDRLDELAGVNQEEPYRVLIVDDSPAVADYYGLVLRDAEVDTRIEHDPAQVMVAVRDFNPDLILMDLYMPVCSGTELASVLRQHESLVGLPIVFLSSETDMDKQVTALGRGGDDFLTKPIAPRHLVSTVIARAKRARVLRGLMMHDSLTGLLNHASIKHGLNTEIGRTARKNQALAVAMIDIDNFKIVNDRFGHLAGDRVIKRLARLLQQRLRRSDLIGRYGGEEFLLVLPDTDAATAHEIIDNLREVFADVRHYVGKEEFTATFSAGVATLPGYGDVAEIIAAADEAMYEAKQLGKNRVSVAD